eukprot:PhF_6_TR569/c0_g1_i1/m.573
MVLLLRVPCPLLQYSARAPIALLCVKKFQVVTTSHVLTVKATGAGDVGTKQQMHPTPTVIWKTVSKQPWMQQSILHWRRRMTSFDDVVVVVVDVVSYLIFFNFSFVSSTFQIIYA